MFNFLSGFWARARTQPIYILTVLFIITALFALYFFNDQISSRYAFLDIEKENNDKQESVDEVEDGTATAGSQETQTEQSEASSTSKKTTKSGSGSSSTSTGASQSTSGSSGSNDQGGSEAEVLSAYVAFYSDNQSDTDGEDQIHQATVNNILATGANPIFHAGDLMEDGTQNSLDRFNSVAATMLATRTFYGALGNNDRQVGDSSIPSPLFLANFSFPNNERWYSINTGNLHLVVLDSAFASGSATQLSWLQNDLASVASTSRITGVMYHHPTFASTLQSYFESLGVDFVIAGHIHTYSRSQVNGIYYFTNSGQPSLGYMTAKIFSNHAEFTTYNVSNSVVDSVSFTER